MKEATSKNPAPVPPYMQEFLERMIPFPGQQMQIVGSYMPPDRKHWGTDVQRKFKYGCYLDSAFPGGAGAPIYSPITGKIIRLDYEKKLRTRDYGMISRIVIAAFFVGLYPFLPSSKRVPKSAGSL